VIKVAHFKQLAPNLFGLNPTRDIGLKKKLNVKLKGPGGEANFDSIDFIRKCYILTILILGITF
jgi:hypothetical protein